MDDRLNSGFLTYSSFLIHVFEHAGDERRNYKEEMITLYYGKTVSCSGIKVVVDIWLICAQCPETLPLVCSLGWYPLIYWFNMAECMVIGHLHGYQFSSVQSLSHVWLFVTPWIAAHQASLSITNSQSLLKLMPIKSVMPSSHLILCRPLFLLPTIPPSIRVFPMSQLFAWGGQRTGVSASASVLPMNTQDWSLLGWTGWISLQSKGLSRVFSNATVQKHQFFGPQFSSQSNSHIRTWPLEKP